MRVVRQTHPLVLPYEEAMHAIVQYPGHQAFSPRSPRQRGMSKNVLGIHCTQGEGPHLCILASLFRGSGQRRVTCAQACMERGEGPKSSHMCTGLHGKRGGAKERSHVHRPSWEEGRGQREVTCTQAYVMGRRTLNKSLIHVGFYIY